MAFFFFNTIFQEIISLSIVLCSFIPNVGSKHDRETKATKLHDFYATHITRITSAGDVGEFLGTFRYAVNEFFFENMFY